MNAFQLTLRNDKKKQYIQIAYLILLLNFLIFVFIGITTNGNRYYFIDAVVILICIALDYFLRKKRDYKQGSYLDLGIFLVALAWIRHENWWAAGTCLILELFFFFSQRDFLVKINAEKIIYPSFPQKKIEWNELSNVLLKDEILTIDFKNNKLIQQYLDTKKQAPDEQEFNEFCKSQLDASKTI